MRESEVEVTKLDWLFQQSILKEKLSCLNKFLINI